MPVIARRRLPSGESAPMLDVADIAGLSGPLELPGVLAGVFGKALEMTPERINLMDKLLGRPIMIGRRLLRLSSADPAQNKAILHDATTGQRIASPLDDFFRAWKEIGADTEKVFPEGAVMSEMGQEVTKKGSLAGPKGGFVPQRRRVK